MSWVLSHSEKGEKYVYIYIYAYVYIYIYKCIYTCLYVCITVDCELLALVIHARHFHVSSFGLFTPFGFAQSIRI